MTQQPSSHRSLPQRCFQAGVPGWSRSLIRASLSKWLLAGLGGGLLLAACVTERRLGSEVIGKARAASEAQRWDEAQELWGKVLSYSRGADREARLALGEALSASGAHRSALEVLRADVPDPGPEANEYWRVTGHAHLAQGQIRAAGAAFSKVLTYEPEDRETLLAYGTALLDTDRAARGIDLLLKALRLDPGDGSVAEKVAQTSERLGQWGSSFEAWYLRVQAPQPPWEAYLSAPLFAGTTPEQAGEWLYEAVRLNPQSSVGWRRIGDWHEEREESGLAVRAWRKSVEVDPMDTQSCAKLAAWFIEAGDCPQARLWIDHALNFLNDEQARAPFENWLSMCD